MTNQPSPRSSSLRLGRCSIAGQAYLITTTTLGREPLFTDLGTGRCLVREMRRLTADGAAESIAWVVMPDHWHWLVRLPDGDASLSSVMNLAKGRSARAINRRLDRCGPVWQSGFHDHALRSEESLVAAARYIIANPLRAGLVRRVGEYPLWDCMFL